ncbi:hypothetical protein JW916_15895 [Candidatus Sumerlaeota bacterium]|nr:hypothetical protein [Candidatus Sumerlaeota bacterium]
MYSTGRFGRFSPICYRLAQICIVALIICAVPAAATAQIAFPQAEGFGKNVTGGRGGSVYHVTNLNNTGTGSLRNAAAMSNVTIVFDVGGYIQIGSKLGFTGSNITVAGQTAPGGIGVKGAQVSVGADNIVFRHMRFRCGKATSDADAFSLNSNVNGAIFDHCSIDFSTDENNSLDNPQNVTAQWTFNAWGLQTHSCGGLLYAQDVTVHHTLWAHNHTRNPKSRNGLLDWVNNTVFDWDIPFICGDTTAGTHWANVDRCYFLSGASGQSKAFTSAATDAYGNPVYHMWLNQTLTDFDTDGILDGTDKGYTVISGTVEQRASRYPAAPQVTTQDATTAHKLVLSLGGATPWDRDEVDSLLVSDVLNQRRRIITRESDLGLSNSGFGTLGGESPPSDTDGDGIPNYVEQALGWSTTAASNNGDHDSDGYTNLEEYLNWLGMPHDLADYNGYVDVDLTKFTSGFAATATYSVANPLNGGVSLLGDGKTARFTAATDYSGFGSFEFTVNDGSVATIEVGILVLSDASGQPPTPNPMTWNSAPNATDPQTIAMTAGTASCSGTPEYYFACISGGGHDSGWQTDTTYTDSDLIPGTEYTYTVKARDSFSHEENTASNPASAATPALPAVPAPDAWWKLDESSGLYAYDSSGNGNTGTLQGTTPPTWDTGVYDGCLTYSGATNGGVYVPSCNSIDFDDEDLSVSFWLKAPASIAEGQTEILKKGTIGAIDDPGTGKRYEFYRKVTATYDNFRFCIDDNVVKSEISILSSVPCTGAWVHVAGVRDTAANQLRLYVDADLKGTATDGTGNISQTEPLNFGDAVMVGSLDSIQIHHAALSGDQIVTLYLGDTAPPQAPTKLTAVGRDGVVQLNWADNTDADVASYNVKRATVEGGPYATVATGLTSSAHDDSTVTNGTQYYYVVSAVDTSDNESNDSNEASTTPGTDPDTTAPNPPTGPIASIASSGVVLDWDDNTESDLASYNVLRATTSGGPYTTVTMGVATSAYTDATATVGATYYYVVTAVDTSTNQSDISGEVCNDTPAAHWPLDETSGTTAYDEGGSMLDGTLYYAGAGAWGPAKVGNGLTFDGFDDFVLVPHGAAIDFATDSFSLCFWLKHAPTGSTSGEEAYVEKGTIGSPGTGKRYNLYSKNGSMFFSIDDNVTKTQVGVSTGYFHTGDWVFVVAVRDAAADEIRLYADAVLVDSTTDVTGSISQDEPMYVGRYAPDAAGPSYMTGEMDDIRVYRYALTTAQVEALMAAAEEPPPPATHNWMLYR